MPRDPGLELKFLLLPALTLALPVSRPLSRLVKASMLEVLGDDYVRTARAKGVAEQGVVLGHALRNALVPVVTVLGLAVRSPAGRRGDHRVGLLVARRSAA